VSYPFASTRPFHRPSIRDCWIQDSKQESSRVECPDGLAAPVAGPGGNGGFGLHRQGISLLASGPPFHWDVGVPVC